MSAPVFWLADLLAVTLLTFALYFPRHHRREMVVAYLGVNTGITAVTAVLVSGTATLGLGLGLFGVLSIIRLRSSTLGQREVAYYFAALALGVLGGMGVTIGWLALAGMALIVTVLAIVDHPRLLPNYSEQSILLDRAYADRTALVAHLESLLGGRVHQVEVRRLDLVKDTTLVDVRFSAPENATAMPVHQTRKTRKKRKTLVAA